MRARWLREPSLWNRTGWAETGTETLIARLAATVSPSASDSQRM